MLMSRRSGRTAAAVLAALALLGALAGCSDDDGSDGAPATTGAADTEVTAPDLPDEETAGLIPLDEWTARQDELLAFATEGELSPGSPLSLLAFDEVARRTGDQPDLSAATVADFAPIFDKLEAFEDTSDFDVNRLITLYLRAGDDLDPDLADAVRQHLLAFKYWWTEPTPDGIVDDQYYWTENHQIIYLADEYIAGQAFPDDTFTNSGMTGAEHVAHALPRLQKWFEWRARFGFSEWLSNVYWNEDLMGVLLLAEFADDPDVAREASMVLDMMFVELAGHVRAGTFGATHGRSYQKDKLNGRDEDTFSLVKMVFDLTPVDYENADTAVLLAIAQRYRPPEVVRRIAAVTDPTVFRTRSGIPLDPHAPVDADVEAPYGLSFEGEDGLMAFWGMGAQFPWQVAPLSLDTVRTYDLFKTANFQQAADLEPIVADADDDTARALAASLATQVNPGLLSQVDTYTYRTGAVMLSSAQDWRPGQRGEQDHISQATFDPDALVFVQHPRDPVPSAEDPEANLGYWTGDGAMPRTAQVQNVAISIYAPQYDGGSGIGSGAYSFTYEPYTHAFFPTEHFDQVVEQDGWVLARKGDGFIALWSHRPTTWRQYTSDEFTRGLTEKFDLIADGGADDVWITEVADADDYGAAGDDVAARFAAFVAAITSARVEVLPPVDCAADAPCPASTDPAAGARVRYASPSQGEITFGWAPKTDDPLLPLTVDGTEVDLHPDDVRWDAPYATADWDEQTYQADLDGASLLLDFDAGVRRTSIGG